MTQHTDSAADAGFNALLTSTTAFRSLIAAIVTVMATLTGWTAVEAAAIDNIVTDREYASVHVLEREGTEQDGSREYASVRVVEREGMPQDGAREYASVRVMEREGVQQDGREYVSIRVAEREGLADRIDLTGSTRLTQARTIDVDALQLHELRRFRGHVPASARAALEAEIQALETEIQQTG